MLGTGEDHFMVLFEFSERIIDCLIIHNALPLPMMGFRRVRIRGIPHNESLTPIPCLRMFLYNGGNQRFYLRLFPQEIIRP